MKRRGFPVSAILSFLLVLVSALSASAGELAVTEGVIAASVENKEPKGVGASFSASIERLYAFTRIEGAEDQTEVKHIWFHGDHKMATMTLTVGPKSWRTWSNKRILPEWTGSWSVEVRSDDGVLLKKIDFSIEPPKAQ